jgi:hypothetical protein
VAALTGVAVLVVFAGVAGDREEDVLEGGLLLDVFDRGGRQQLSELGQGAVDDDPALVEDRDPVGELFGTVVLPAPLEPSRAKMLPRATSKSTPRSTRSSLYDFSRPCTWIAGPRTRLAAGGMLMTASMEG